MTGSGPAAILIQRRIEWSDTDASGHYHNTAAFRFLEWAETALLARLGILDDVYGFLPRVHVTANFRKLLDHHDLVDIDLWVLAVGHSSIRYGVEIRRGPDVCAEVEFVCALVDGSGRPRPWADDHKRLLLRSGRQAPELLVTGDGRGATGETG